MKTIQYCSTLYYYDGPQVFEACDEGGGRYVSVMLEPASGHDRILVTGASIESLQRFRVGLLDLRSLLLEQGEREWFLAEARGGLEGPLALVSQAGSLLDSDLLPDSGFILKQPA